MARKIVFARILTLVFFTFVTIFIFACNNSPTVSTSILIKESPVVIESPLLSNKKPTEVTKIPAKVFPTVNPCNPDVVFQSDNVRWARWIPFSDEIYYGMVYETDYFSYSISENNVRNENSTFEKYYARMVSQFGIDPSLTNQISPDHLQIIYSDVISDPLSIESDQEEQIKEYVSKIYLKNINQKELFVGELEGIVYSFHWASDMENVVLVMSTYSTSSLERGAIYLLNPKNKTIKVILPFYASQSDYSFRGFSYDDQWVFIGSGKSKWAWNILDG